MRRWRGLDVFRAVSADVTAPSIRHWVHFSAVVAISQFQSGVQWLRAVMLSMTAGLVMLRAIRAWINESGEHLINAANVHRAPGSQTHLARSAGVGNLLLCPNNDRRLARPRPLVLDVPTGVMVVGAAAASYPATHRSR